MSARRLVNSISLTRIGLAFLFVVFFQPRPLLSYACIVLWLLALATDLLDGYLARRLNVASIHGRLWDSLGDKSFYTAVIIAFLAQNFIGVLLAWSLLVREIALYITRVLFVEKLPHIERIRPWTNWHGYCFYLLIILGLWRMWAETHGLSLSVHSWMQVSGYAALFFGIGSIVHFLRIKE